MPVTMRPRPNGLRPFCAGAMAVGLIFTGATAHADDGDTPSTPAPIVTGETIQGPPVVVQSPGELKIPGGTTVNLPSSEPIKICSAVTCAPVAEKVAPYEIEHLSGTYNYKLSFRGDDVAETRVLAADSGGGALDASRVRLAYLMKQSGTKMVFWPATGKIERVSDWPALYPAPVPARAAGLANLFGSPEGPKWLEEARMWAVIIAAAVILVAVVVIAGPLAAPVAAAVPLAW